jgi:tetratricopeptide (TPR) repeat protein
MRALSIILLVCLGFTLFASTCAPSPKKEATARRVFDRLVAARGDYSMPEPRFLLATSRRSGARCEDEVVVLEEAAYDICMEFGESAEAVLASVLAHELIHYYAGHVGGGEARSLVADDEPVEPVSVAQESEADYRGGFLAYLAGYPVTGLVPRFLDRLYAAYSLPEQLAGYPSLTQRKELAIRTHRRLQELTAVFEMANVLTALERYGEAATYYDYLLRAFPSREMHNNAGVVYACAALPYFQPATLAYVYPIELDLRSRLKEQTRGVGVDPATRNFYLGEARKHFTRARLLDPDYVPALINLASVHALLSASLTEQPPSELDREVAADHRLEAALRAREAIRLAQRLENPTAAVNAHLLLGILAATEGDTVRAESHFDRADGSSLVTANRAIFHTGKLPPLRPAPTSSAFSMMETINGQALTELLTGSAITSTLVAGGRDRMVLETLPAPTEGVQLLRHTGGTNTGLSVALVTEPYPGTTAMEVGIGNARADILREYGAPAYTVTVVGGELLVYPENGLIFSLRAAKVKGWYLY